MIKNETPRQKFVVDPTRVVLQADLIRGLILDRYKNYYAAPRAPVYTRSFAESVCYFVQSEEAGAPAVEVPASVLSALQELMKP